MGCFFACFSASKNKKQHHLVPNGTSSNDQKHEANEVVQSSEEEDFGIPFNSIIVKKEKLGELLNYSGKKKVTFDLNVKINEELLTQNNRNLNSAESEDELEDLDLEVSDLGDDNEDGKAENEPQLVMEESSESLFSLSIESRKQVCEVELDEKEVTSPMPIDKSPNEDVKPIGLNPNAKERDDNRFGLSKGTPRTRSRNIQEEKQKWNAIPFEARLERALDKGGIARV
ncbi:hypothetical protein REPUB_Repub16aG0108000 [Reevesia pubescens]